MRSFLFPGLTAGSKRGQALFDHAVREARQPFWYRECEVPDTIDGRFAMLATVSALVIVRLEAGGEAGETVSAALTGVAGVVVRSREVRGAARRVRQPELRPNPVRPNPLATTPLAASPRTARRGQALTSSAAAPSVARTLRRSRHTAA